VELPCGGGPDLSEVTEEGQICRSHLWRGSDLLKSPVSEAWGGRRWQVRICFVFQDEEERKEVRKDRRGEEE
jgi:hypothetical protein